MDRLSEHEVEMRYPEGYALWRRTRCGGWDDGESYDARAARVVEGVHEIARPHPGEHILADEDRERLLTEAAQYAQEYCPECAQILYEEREDG